MLTPVVQEFSPQSYTTSSSEQLAIGLQPKLSQGTQHLYG